MAPCRPLPRHRLAFAVALAASLVLHAGVLAPWRVRVAPVVEREFQVRLAPAPVAGETARPRRAEPVPPPHRDARRPPEPVPAAAPAAFLAAPAPPSAEEWRLAASYRLKNSKRYRHAWGQQVRSMMGTAVAGPDQGMVRFRIEIAPGGQVARVEELWSTSAAASRLAWRAIRALPPLPPTPTGKALVFEQTISFLPFETGWPPSYRLDCLPEPPEFRNRFAWDGRSAMATGQVPAGDDGGPDDGAPAPECRTDATAATIEEEDRELKRQMDQWRWGR